jgi:hypothetical protein
MQKDAVMPADTTTVPIRPFPQLNRHEKLSSNLLRSLYSKATNNEFAFRMLNRPFRDGLCRVKVPALTSAGQRVASELKKHGVAFAHFDEFFPATSFDEIKACFDGYREAFNDARNKSGGTIKGKEVFLDTIHKSHTFTQDDAASRYLADPGIAAIAAEYMGIVPRYVGSSFWHTKPAPGEGRVFSQKWHRDYNDRRLVKMFLYLNDIGSKNGFFEPLTGWHVGGPLGAKFDSIGPDGYRAYPDQSEAEAMVAQMPIVSLAEVPQDRRYGPNAPWADRPTRIQCTGPAGSLIFCDTFGMHRGGFVQEGQRDLIMTTYSTNFNIHKPHFAVTEEFAASLDPFMRMVFGLE